MLFRKKISTDAAQNVIGHLENGCQDSPGRRSSLATQFEIRMKLVSTGRANHNYSADIFWNSQLLSTFRTFLLGMISHDIVITPWAGFAMATFP
jgi:hypothetical protein